MKTGVLRNPGNGRFYGVRWLIGGILVATIVAGAGCGSAPPDPASTPRDSVERGGSVDRRAPREPNRRPHTPRAAAREQSSALAQAPAAAHPSVPDFVGASQPPERAAVEFTDAAIEERLFESARYLASDELEGRGVRTRGLDLAADYIAERFREAGLKIDLYDGSPFHTFSISRRLGLGETNELMLSGPDGRLVTLVLARDFTPISLSGSGEFDVPLVFAGYGISAEGLGYDDYAGLDVRGQAVIVLRREPRQADPDSVFDGLRHTRHAYFTSKIEVAVERGAAAVILCTDHHSIDHQRDVSSENGPAGRDREAPDATGTSRPPLADLDPLVDFQIRAQIGRRTVPVVHMRRAVLEPIVQSALGTSLAALEQRIDDSLTPQSAALPGWRIRGTVSVLPRGRALKNVLGVLDGSGPLTDETIVIGAHYDHLGRGGWGSLAMDSANEIHNGADDNASGTVVLLEVARQLAARDRPLPRRVLFIAFSAEEMGLVGSSRYVRNPLIPMGQTIAMINLDMVGRLRNDRLAVYGTGTAIQFDPLLDRLSETHSLSFSRKRSGYGPSDHASFHEHGVPVLHFFTGFHPQYHRPSDDYERLNVAGMRRIAAMVTDLVTTLATGEDRPGKPPASGGREAPNASNALQSLLAGEQSDDSTRSAADERDDASASSGATPTGPPSERGRESRAYLGVATDPDRDGEGCLVAQVVAESAADHGGIRQGDVLHRFGSDPISKPDDLAAAVDRHKPGDRVSALLQRGRIELEVIVTLGRRP